MRSVIGRRSSSRSTMPSGRHAQDRQLPALRLEPAARVEHRLVLGCDRDDVIAASRLACAAPLIARLFDSVAPLVKTISPADALMSAAILRSRGVDRFLRFPAERVLARGGVAEPLAEVRQHRLEHTGIDGRGRVVIEIDRLGHEWPSSARTRQRHVMRVGRRAPRSVSRSTPPAASRSPAPTRIRSLIRQSGSRTLHLAY